VSWEQGCDPRNELLIRFVDCNFFPLTLFASGRNFVYHISEKPGRFSRCLYVRCRKRLGVLGGGSRETP